MAPFEECNARIGQAFLPGNKGLFLAPVPEVDNATPTPSLDKEAIFELRGKIFIEDEYLRWEPDLEHCTGRIEQQLRRVLDGLGWIRTRLDLLLWERSRFTE